MTSPQQPLVFYDIASGPPIRCFAPNPWKTRYALNFKRLPYRTEWVDMPDIPRVRASLGVAAVRKHADGTPFYTLPVLQDASRGRLVGDSFDIAVYLDSTYPDRSENETQRRLLLFPPGAQALSKAFNTYVDGLFTAAVPLFAHGMPLNPDTAAATKAEMCRRLGLRDWEEAGVRGEARGKMLRALEGSLEGLAEAYRRTKGPFLEGGLEPSYADFVVGAWLVTFSICCPEWEALRGWQGGVWGRLHDALEPYRKGE
ncbi:hypothetical protein F4810DRAFT_713222 [Camillea tinctor]|nr:hypothetical protein F4810DRAFT_713222 [Camillea tinctor]